MGSGDKYRHISWRVLISSHEFMGERRLLELEHARKARIHTPFAHEIVEGVGLIVVREVRALKAFLAHPEIAQIDFAQL